MGNAYAGQILRVNLTKGDWKVEELDMDLVRRFIGGRGLGGKILFDEVDPNVDPLGPENKLIFVTGPLTGTGAPTGCRYMVVAKSPLTGAIGYANSGGYLGAELKFAGYDGIIFEGKSEKPVYLSIDDDEIELKPASHLWGKSSTETDELIKAELGDQWRGVDTRVSCIGPAGEKLSRIAAIMTENSAAARTGLAAVMGSKNLKAIAVRGTKGVRLADAESFRAKVAEQVDVFRDHPAYGQFGTMHVYGTAAGMALGNVAGALPTRHFSGGTFEAAEAELDPQLMRETTTVRQKGCFACPIACKRVSKTTAPGFEGHGEGPEFETLCLLGICCGVNNLQAIIKAGFICNEMGLDTISTGVTIACAMELYERGYITDAEAGCKLNFGNAESMVEMTRKIGLREGIGDILAEGAYRTAEKFGHPEVFIGAKKMEMPAHHARGLQGMGLGYATSNRGACHNSAMMSSHEFPAIGTGTVTKGKPQMVKHAQELAAVVDSCGLCLFPTGVLMQEGILLLFNEATGFNFELKELMLAGERIWNQERLFNLKAGFTKADDTVSRRMLEEPLPDGPAEGNVLRLGEMLPEYYQLRGWNEDGIPSAEKLAALGLDHVKSSNKI
ncbi:MAG: aldehyde ferredoxin oxidoreductase family protein [Dehalococcoidia bacterium]|nr:aldehyde ferredoxin oxidoreductase family protein [Dehalococcoidia bacterium]